MCLGFQGPSWRERTCEVHWFSAESRESIHGTEAYTSCNSGIKLTTTGTHCLFFPMQASHRFILSFLPQDINRTELGLLMTQKDPYTGKTNKKKPLRTFSFLSKIKVARSVQSLAACINTIVIVLDLLIYNSITSLGYNQQLCLESSWCLQAGKADQLIFCALFLQGGSSGGRAK